MDGRELIKILCNKFGFVKVRQKGSHVTLQRNGTFVTVPIKEVRVGLLTRILRDCNKRRFSRLFMISDQIGIQPMLEITVGAGLSFTPTFEPAQTTMP